MDVDDIRELLTEREARLEREPYHELQAQVHVRQARILLAALDAVTRERDELAAAGDALAEAARTGLRLDLETGKILINESARYELWRAALAYDAARKAAK